MANAVTEDGRKHGVCTVVAGAFLVILATCGKWLRMGTPILKLSNHLVSHLEVDYM